MKLDERAQRAATGVRRQLDALEVPDSRVLLRRARRRRWIARTMAVTTIGATTVVGVIVTTDDTDRARIQVGNTRSRELPSGALTRGGWASVPKDAAGLGAGSSFHTVTSDGQSVLLAGARQAADGGGPAIWRSDDGLHWVEVERPSPSGVVNAITLAGGVAVAVGSDGADGNSAATSFVWRSEDGGRTWTEIARGSDLFGPPAPQMGRPFVSGLLHRDDRWVAYGGASNGYAGIWVSRDGKRWEQTLSSDTAGSVERIVEGSDGDLFAYWSLVGWYASDPSSWGEPTSLSAPSRVYPSSVAPGADLAVGSNIDRHGVPTPLLRSGDGGRSWTSDDSFLAQFPDAWVWSIDRAAGLWVGAGTSGEPNHPDAWVSAEDGVWHRLPEQLYGPPGGTLSLVAATGDEIVLIGTAPELDRYYVLDARAVRESGAGSGGSND